MKILLIEDDIEIIDFLQSALEAEGFNVDIAKDGEKGSYLARTNNYDLIVLDYILPKMNGKEVCKEIRRDQVQTPIIILTVRSEVKNRIELLNLGADDYLSKPFSFEELVARMKAILRRPPAVTTNLLRVGDLTMDVKKNIVKRAGKEIYLTRKEFWLLEILMRNSGNVLSRGVIMEKVWDMNAGPFSNTVEAHMRNLRVKVDKFFDKPLIHTIPGRGYKMDAPR